MDQVRVPHDGLVLVADGRKAIFLRNKGVPDAPTLLVEQVLEAPENPPTHLQGTDTPGRAITGSRRSAMEQTDWHARAARTFAQTVATQLTQWCREQDIKAVVVIAPPRALADLREAFAPSIRQLIIAEIALDLTKQPVREIERHFT